jgi:hypothetical protein
MTNTSEEFRRCYLRAIALASIVFAFSHQTQLTISGYISQHSFATDPTGFITLIFMASLEGIVFFSIGYVVAYVPSRVIYRIVKGRYEKNSVLAVFIGFVIGVISLPLCASVSFFILRAPDEPSYFARCVEFALPMIAAGAFGGYVFWRCLQRGSATEVVQVPGI